MKADGRFPIAIIMPSGTGDAGGIDIQFLALQPESAVDRVERIGDATGENDWFSGTGDLIDVA